MDLGSRMETGRFLQEVEESSLDSLYGQDTTQDSIRFLYFFIRVALITVL